MTLDPAADGGLSEVAAGLLTFDPLEAESFLLPFHINAELLHGRQHPHLRLPWPDCYGCERGEFEVLARNGYLDRPIRLHSRHPALLQLQDESARAVKGHVIGPVVVEVDGLTHPPGGG